MINGSEYVAGWLDSSIHHFLRDVAVPPPSMAYALMTCLDSSQDVPALLKTSAALKNLEHAKTIGKGLLVKTSQLLSAERRQRLFFGFDEVWFFPHASISVKPKSVLLHGPQASAHEPPPKMVAWLIKNRCSLGLGDGTGLNFVAKLHGVAKYLVHEYVEALNGAIPV